MTGQQHASRNRRLIVLAMATVLVLLLMGGAVAMLAMRQQPELKVTGVVLEVEGNSLVLPQSILVGEYGGGKLWRFKVDPAAVADPAHPMNAAHLRQHLAFADPITVYYRNGSDGPIAYRIVDGTAPGTS